MVKKYTFKYDWFIGNISVFEKYLSAYIEKPCHFLEIGTYEGRSTTWLLDNILTHTNAHIDCIDMWIQDVLFDNLDKTGVRNKVTFHQGSSTKVLKTFEFEEFDFIYIDGCHNAINVLEDAVLSFRLLRNNGIMAFDDYLWNSQYNGEEYSDGTNPKPAIDAFLSIYGHKIKLLYKEYQVWIQKVSN
ncbi:class I SAM-dependent methyltransferase [Brasilonema sp. CT11]|nr:class I SAM-dependent methyltransferase [Brasilonema sp. CT11]